MTFKKDLIIGLSKKNKRIPSKYHYDLQGSKYFEKITKQKEYYPTRKEKEILKLGQEYTQSFEEDFHFKITVKKNHKNNISKLTSL